MLVTDASFANARSLKSQLGYIILMVDDEDNCNVVHYGSNRCRRVVQIVMVAELFALILGFDYALVVRDILEDMTGRVFPIETLVDSKTVFEIVAKQAQTTEKRLKIDAVTLMQSYDEGELEKMGWFPGYLNPADPLTKLILSLATPLFLIMQTNKFPYREKGWVTTAPKRKVVLVSIRIGRLAIRVLCSLGYLGHNQ